MQLHRVHVVPVWSDGTRVHVARIGEVRPDLEDYVIGWANLAEITLGGDRRIFLLVNKTDE